MKRLVLAICTLLYSSSTLADSYYPHRAVRVLGTNQRGIPSCQGHAENLAMEQALATTGGTGYTLMMSPFYRTNRLWSLAKDDFNAISPQFNMTTAEHSRLKGAMPDFLPSYMWPEDGARIPYQWDEKEERKDPTKREKMPRMSSHAIIDDDFVRAYNASNIGFKKHYLQLNNTIGCDYCLTFDNFKQMIKNREALVLAVHSDFFKAGYFDEATGLFSKNGYDGKKFRTFIENQNKNRDEQETFANAINHSVTVLGFDDNFYGTNNGAFFVRNSWNDSAVLRDTLEVEEYYGQDPEITKELDRFRYKIRKLKNTAGLYALPYSYVMDMIKNGNQNDETGTSVYRLSFNRVTLASLYRQFEERYQEHTIPYLCHTKGTLETSYLDGYIKGRQTLERYKNATKRARTTVEYKKAQAHINTAIEAFRDRVAHIARLSVRTHPSRIDRVDDFLNNRLNDYYCPDKYMKRNPFKRNLFPDTRELSSRHMETFLRHAKRKNARGSYTLWLKFLDMLACRTQKKFC